MLIREGLVVVGFILIIVILSESLNAHAHSVYVSKIQSVQAEAKVFAEGQLPNIQEYAKTDIEENKEIKKGLNYQGTDIPEKDYSDGNMADAAKKMKEKQEQENKGGSEGKEIKITSSSLISLNQQNRETHLEAIQQSNLLDRAKHAQANPREYVDFLSGKYSDCEEVKSSEVRNTTSILHLCDEYVETTENHCAIGKIVEVDAKHNYKCIKEKKRYTKTCQKELILRCEAKEGIADPKKYFQMWGIGAVNILFQNADRIEYQIKRSENFSTGNGDSGLVNTAMSFYVGDLDRIQSFFLSSMNFKTLLMLKINGHLVFSNGLEGDEMRITHAGNHYFATNKLYDYGFYRKDYKYMKVSETTPSSGFIDLKPYLRAKQMNTIRSQVVYRAHGYFNMDYRVVLKPECSKWNEEWMESCE